MIGNLWEKYLTWCKSKSGQTICHRSMFAVNVGVFSALYFPQTYFLENYKEVVQLYNNRKPSPVPDNIKSLFNEVLDDLKVKKEDRELIKPFMVIGFDVFEAGISNSGFGGIIGIPMNFTFKVAQDLEASRILINNFPADVSRRETEELTTALVLSEDAKKFAIAREIQTFQKSNRLTNCAIACAIFQSCNIFSNWMKKKYNLYNKSLRSRILLYTVTGFAGLSLYFTQKDFFRRTTEKSIDEELAKLGPNYVKGGHEFYTKLLERNIAHRKLIGKHGNELYKEDGNYFYYIRQKTLPITKRKSFFEEKISEFMKENKSPLIEITSEIEIA